MATRYTGTLDIGDVMVMTVTFTNAAGTAVDPTAVTASAKAPDGTESEPAVTPGATGVYTVRVPATQAGEWYAAVRGTGTNQSTVQAVWFVQPDYA